MALKTSSTCRFGSSCRPAHLCLSPRLRINGGLFVLSLLVGVLWVLAQHTCGAVDCQSLHPTWKLTHSSLWSTFFFLFSSVSINTDYFIGTPLRLGLAEIASSPRCIASSRARTSGSTTRQLTGKPARGSRRSPNLPPLFKPCYVL